MRKNSSHENQSSENIIEFPYVDFEELNVHSNIFSELEHAEPSTQQQQQQQNISNETTSTGPRICISRDEFKAVNLLTKEEINVRVTPKKEEFSRGLDYISDLYDQTARKSGAVRVIPPDNWKCPLTINTTTFKFLTRKNNPSSMSLVSNYPLDAISSQQKFHGNDKTLEKNSAKATINKSNSTAETSSSTATVDPYDSNDLYRIFDRPDAVVLSYIFVLGKAVDLLQIKQWLQLSKQKNLLEFEFWSQAAQHYKLDVNSLRNAYNLYAETGVTTRTGNDGGSPINRPAKRVKRQNHIPKCKLCAQEGSSLVTCCICQSNYHYACVEAPFAPFSDIHYWTCNSCIPSSLKILWKEVDYHCISSFLQSSNELASSLKKQLPSFLAQTPLTLPSNTKTPPASARQSSRRTRSTSGKGFETKISINLDSDIKLLNTLSPLETFFWCCSFPSTASTSSPFSYYPESLPTPLLGRAVNTTAFPTSRQNAYYNDPWNLYFIHFSKLSPLRFTPPGILTSTISLGQPLTCQGWQRDSMSLFGMHYHHYGAQRIWYVIPEVDGPKYEKLLNDLSPSFIQEKPETLIKSKILLPISMLISNGIQVLTFVQNSNEFVITSPNTYYTVLDTGFSLSESVPFATKEWIQDMHAENSFNMYQDLHIPAPFSLDHILLANATLDKTVHSAYWLMTCLKDRVDRELTLRNEFRKRHPLLTWIPTPLESSVMACAFCKTFAYLASIEEKNGTKTACLSHKDECFPNTDSDLTVLVRYDDNALLAAYNKVVERAHKADTWLENYKEALGSDNSRPSLKVLKTLLNEAETICCPLQEVSLVRNLVKTAQQWLDKFAIIFKKKPMVKKDKRKPKRGSATHSHLESPSEEVEDLNSSNINEADLLINLVEEAEQFTFDFPEMAVASEKAESLKIFREKANAMKERSLSYEECLAIVEEGESLQLKVPELLYFKQYMEKTEWIDSFNQISQKTDSTMEELVELIERGEKIGLTSDNENMATALLLKEKSENWMKQVEGLLSQETLSTSKLFQLKSEANSICINRGLLEQLNEVLQKSENFHTQLVSLISRARDPDFYSRPTIEEAKTVLAESENLTNKPEEYTVAQKLLTQTYEWVRRGKRLFGKANAPLEIFNQHLEFVEQRNTNAMVDEGSDAPFHVGNEYYVIAGSDPSDFHYCFCRQPEAGMMIECELCHEWYHAKCMKMSKKKLRADEKFICPICDYRVEVPRHSHRPPLIELQKMVDDIPTLPFQPIEIELLKRVVKQAEEFKNKMQSEVCDPTQLSEKDVPLLQFYLRKLEGSEILFTEELNVFRQKLHEFMPVAPQPPPFIGESRSNRKPRPTKRQREIMEQVESGKLTSAEGAAAIAATQTRNQNNFISKPFNVHTLSTTLSPWAMKSLAQAAISPNPMPSAHDLLSTSNPAELFTNISPEIKELSVDSTSTLGGLNSSHPVSDQNASVICLCRQPFAISDGTVQCHNCLEWFHYECVGLSSDIVSTLSNYACPDCCSKEGKLYPWNTRPRSTPSVWLSQAYSPSVLQGTTENVAFLNKSFSASANLFDVLPVSNTPSHFSKMDYVLEDRKPDLFTETYLSM
ncbi:Multi-copy suppressor-Chk1 [Schizosaccharomyces pombe]